MKGALKTILVLLFLCIVGMAYKQPVYYPVTASDIYVRSDPSTQFMQFTHLHKDKTVVDEQTYDD